MKPGQVFKVKESGGQKPEAQGFFPFSFPHKYKYSISIALSFSVTYLD